MIDIVIFLITTVFMFFIVFFRCWEIKTGQKDNDSKKEQVVFPHIPFRHIEKNMLYLTKHVAQWLVLVTVKYWIIGVIKIKKTIKNKSPKIRNYIEKRRQKAQENKKMSFLKRSILESKFKIKRMKQKIKEEIE